MSLSKFCSKFSKSFVPMKRVMIRPSPACPPEFLRGMTRGIISAFAPITVSNQQDEEWESRPCNSGSSVMLVGAGRVGQHLANEIIPIFNIKNLIIVDKDLSKCDALLEGIKAMYPRTSILCQVSDITQEIKVEETLQTALSHSNGLLDIIIDATNLTREANQEDTMTPSTMALSQFQRMCLDVIQQRGQFATFDNSEGLPPSLYKDASISLHYRSLSIDAKTRVKRSEFIKACIESIQQSRNQHHNGKVMFSFSRPRLLDD
ncbi:uncharacterized protein [Amphiura filiformis]|uniref:uncharacterized protein n=1 Tax=Amphiura filiformis TaxID=82378 RepID=UPI003B216904